MLVFAAMPEPMHCVSLHPGAQTCKLTRKGSLFAYLRLRLQLCNSALHSMRRICNIYKSAGSAYVAAPTATPGTAGAADEKANGARPQQYDFAVVGAGIFGCTLAYYLTLLDKSVLLIERRAGPALESTFKAGGFIFADATWPETAALAEHSCSLHAEHARNPAFKAAGYLPKTVLQLEPAASGQPSDKVPFFPGIKGMRMTKSTNGMVVQPRALCEVLLKLALERSPGSLVMYGFRVTNILCDDEQRCIGVRMQSVDDPRLIQDVPCGGAAFACGAWSRDIQSFLPRKAKLSPHVNTALETLRLGIAHTCFMRTVLPAQAPVVFVQWPREAFALVAEALGLGGSDEDWKIEIYSRLDFTVFHALYGRLLDRLPAASKMSGRQQRSASSKLRSAGSSNGNSNSSANAPDSKQSTTTSSSSGVASVLTELAQSAAQPIPGAEKTLSEIARAALGDQTAEVSHTAAGYLCYPSPPLLVGPLHPFGASG